MNVDRLVITGCSFTAGSSDIPTALEQKSVWSHHLIEPWNVKVLVNLAMEGCGNVAAGFNLKWFLLNHPKEYLPDNTRVCFNLTGLDRADLLTYSDHNSRNRNWSWSSYCDFAWITNGGFHEDTMLEMKPILKHSGYKNIILQNQMAIIDTILFLEHNHYQYAFMCMEDSIINDNRNSFFESFIKDRLHNYIKLDNLNMAEYCKLHGWTREDDGWHPSKTGHEKIAEHVLKHFQKKVDLLD